MATGISPARMNMTRTASTAPGSTATPPRPRCSTNSLHQIYATSWRRTGQYFPLAWDLDSSNVPAVNVSARYAALGWPRTSTANVVHVRLRDKPEGERLTADVELRSVSGQLLARDHTRAGSADLNDMPDFTLPDHAVERVLFASCETAKRGKRPCPVLRVLICRRLISFGATCSSAAANSAR